MENYKKIVFATDFSRNSDCAFQDACDIARTSGAQLYVLNVVPEGGDLGIPNVPNSGVCIGPGEMREEIEKRYAAKTDVKVEPAVRCGSPAKEILQFVKELGPDLLVMGARGAGLSGLIKLGSVTERVIRHADTRVLVVPVMECHTR